MLKSYLCDEKDVCRQFFLVTKRMSSDHKRWHLFYYKRVNPELSLSANQLRMIKDKRYPLGAILIAIGQPIGNTSIYAPSAHIVVHIAQLVAQFLIYVMYDIVIIYCSLG